jgi:hypothetical protein
MNLNTNRLLAYDPLEYNTIYKPNSIVNVIAIALVAAVFVCMIVNIVCKGTYYRQLLDLLQFVAATIYL